MLRADGPIQAAAVLYQPLVIKRTSVLSLRAAELSLEIADTQPKLAFSSDALPAAVRRAFARLAGFGPESQDFDATAI